LRFLFAGLIDEELHRDAAYRRELMAKSSKPSSLRRVNAPPSVVLPQLPQQDAQSTNKDDDTAITPKATNGVNGTPRPTTPGLTIGLATPHATGPNHVGQGQTNIPTTIEEGTTLQKQASQHSQGRLSTERAGDYFSSSPNNPKRSLEGQTKSPTTPGDGTTEAATQSPVEGDKDEKSKEGGSLFGKKFRMGFPKMKGRSSVEVKPTVVDEKSEESDRSEDKEDKTVQDGFYGTIQKIRYGYEETIHNQPSQHLQSTISPSLLNETPNLLHPASTSVIIQEERADGGGVADLYRGTVSSLGADADSIEKAAPMWLGDLLLLVCPFGCIRNLRPSLIVLEPHTQKGPTQGLFHTFTLSRCFTEYRGS